jgi:hypothetical protein
MEPTMPQDQSPHDIAIQRAASDHYDRARRPARPSRYLFDDRLYRALRELGLSVRIEFDIEEWKSFIRATEWPVVNSVADPAFHDFVAGEVFWLRLLQGSETVATQVLRIITTDDYIGMVRDHSLFFGDHPSGFRDFQLLSEGRLPKIDGLVTHLSGLYIRPQWRRARTADGMRLVAAWTRLTHSFTARNLMADWSVSLIEARVATPRMIEDLYGYPHATDLFETYVPELDRRERVTLIWMSAAEQVDSVASRPRPAAQSGHLAPRMAG